MKIFYDRKHRKPRTSGYQQARMHGCIHATLPKAAPSNSSSLPPHFGGHSEKSQVVNESIKFQAGNCNTRCSPNFSISAAVTVQK